MAVVECRLVQEEIDAAAVLASVADAAAGAHVLFVGTTRGVTGDVVTLGLEYEAHETLATSSLCDLAAEAVRTYALTGCAIVHRLGAVPVGNASVAVATSAPHRREAFAAAEWLMERIKRDVPIWKREEAADGSRTWVHPGGPPAAAMPEQAS